MAGLRWITRFVRGWNGTSGGGTSVVEPPKDKAPERLHPVLENPDVSGRVRPPGEFGLAGLCCSGDDVFMQKNDHGSLTRAKLPRIGRGDWGVVFEAPGGDGVVLKMVRPRSGALFFGQPASDADVFAHEAMLTTALAASGAGPRLLGCVRIPIHGDRWGAGFCYGLLKERVYGDTIEALAWQRRFDISALGLVLDVLEKLAADGKQPQDLKRSNIMIGRTLLGPERRALVVDAGKLVRHPPEVSSGVVLHGLLNQPTAVGVGIDRNTGFETVVQLPMKRILHEATHRSQQRGLLARLLQNLGEWQALPAQPMPRQR
jgi:hypothetical protein